MAMYKIFGIATEEAVIYIIQNEEYKGSYKVMAGKYEMIFESNSIGNILVVAENINGKIIGFGKAAPINIIKEVF